MSTSDIKYLQNKNRITTLNYLFATVFCIVFSVIYEFFSNDVYSLFMLGAFIIPLVAGALPFFILSLIPLNKKPSAFNRYVYHSGVATLTVGSIMQGILQIYGTTNSLIKYYWLVGFSLTAFGILLFTVRLLLKNK